MTGQPPEETERIYTRQYGDYAQQGQHAQGQYGPDRYAERPYGASQYGTGPYDTSQFDATTSQFERAEQFDTSSQFPGDSQFPGESPFPGDSQFGEPRYRETPAGYPASSGGYPAQQSADPSGYGQPGPAAGYAPPGEATARGPARGVRARAGGEAAKGFVGALFDFDFTSFVTPKIIKMLYVLTVAALALGSLTFVLFAFNLNTLFGVIALFVLAPVGFVVGVAFYRMVLEFSIALFRMADDIRELRERGDQNSAQS